MLIDNQNLLIKFLGVFAIALVFRWFGKHRGIIAIVSNRSLHQLPAVKGLGIILLSLPLFTWDYHTELNLLYAMLLPCLVAGFLDDLLNFSLPIRLVQYVICAGLLSVSVYHGSQIDIPLLATFILLPLVFFIIINYINFTDGIDGYLSVLIITLLVYSCTLYNETSVVYPLSLNLLIFFFVFLFFNFFTPLKSFIGDAGSMGCSAILIFYIVRIIDNPHFNPVLFAIIFLPTVVDFVLCQFIRLFILRLGVRPHRSHAYQNMAVRFGSHATIIIGLVSLQAVFLTLAYVLGDYSWMILLLAFCFYVAVSLRFGPLYSSA
jgi:Fuc2NAc and GlcNAc transferase